VSPESATTGKPGGGRARRGISRAALLYQAPLLIPLALFIVALFMLLSFAGDAASSDLVQSVLETALPLILVGLGQTLVVLTGGIDLSVGGILSLATAIVATQVTTDADMAVWLPLLVVIGLAAGAINGAVIVFTRIQPFIVTLASWSIFSGIALAILPTQGGTVAPGLTNALTGMFGSVSKALVIVVVLIGAWVVLRKTRFGIAVYAIGSSATAAELNGYNVSRGKIIVYSLSGLAATLGGIYYAVSTQSGSANAGDPFILLSVAAVVIGGTSLFGGRGGFVGTVLGAMIIYFIPQIVFFGGAESYTASLFQGLLLMLAILIFAVIEIVVARRTAAVSGG
jgi:ribose transport system permease protein